MNRCPISYELCGKKKYSRKGLRLLSPYLKSLCDFPLTTEEQRQEAAARADKMSIQGVQPKLSARLSVKESTFKIVDKGGHYILKPQHLLFSEIPQNEDLTMRLAKLVGIGTPLHGMLYSKDGSLTYFIKRFDRVGKIGKISVEDFAQLAGKNRDTKYDYSMEKLIPIIERYCTFPALEKLKLFRLTIFNFLVGNEDMHLKNFSLLRRGAKVELSPAYDLVNTTIAMKNPIEELALPLRGKKRHLQARDFFEYYAKEKMNLTDKSIAQIATAFQKTFPAWEKMIEISFLSKKMKEAYWNLISRRREVLSW
jgi:serine/threonine-protein kinase HipA